MALCRSRGIPARLLSGLIVTGDQEQGLHYWAEAWVDNEWLPLCPTFHYFGLRQFPTNYLVVQIGEQELISGTTKPFQASFSVRRLPDLFASEPRTSGSG